MMMLKAWRAAQALERTRPHPLDARVRLTSRPGDLIALHNKGIKAVIWEMEHPRDVKDDLEGLAKTRDRFFTWRPPELDVCPLGSLVRKEGSKDMPPAIKKDILSLAQIFRRAHGDFLYGFYHMHNLRDNIFPGAPVKYTRGYPVFVDDKNRETTKDAYTLPHVDGVVTRFLKIYCLDPEMGTVWFPGDIERDVAQKIRYESEDKILSVRELRDLWLPLNPQTIPPGCVAFFKGDRGGFPWEEQFLHSAPILKPNMPRLVYIA